MISDWKIDQISDKQLADIARGMRTGMCGDLQGVSEREVRAIILRMRAAEKALDCMKENPSLEDFKAFEAALQEWLDTKKEPSR